MKRIHRIPIVLSILLLLSAYGVSALSGCGPGEDEPVLKPGGLQAGDKAYDFSLMSSSGQLVKQSQISPNWYLVLVLYRGHWCSACQEQLAELKTDFAKFTALHTTIAAISVDSLEDSADLNRQWNFPFPLLSDTRLKVIDAYGARHVGGHGIHDIARPTVIIINPRQIVRFKYIGQNAADRPRNNEILFAVQQIQKQDGFKP
ncbi:MAG TPA: peroxiredoxin family protein [bacterium]